MAMKIGLVIESFDPMRGGAEHWTWQFARWLLAANHEVHVVARHFPKPLAIDVVPHSLEGASSRLRFAEAAERTVRDLALDIIHDMGSGWTFDILQLHSGARAATFEQNLLLMPPGMRALKRRVAPLLPRYRQFEQLSGRQLADRGQLIVVPSKMVARDLERYHRVAPERIRLIYNGVDSDRFSPARALPNRRSTRAALGVSDETLLLLIAAHNFRLKGVPTLIRGLAELRREGRRVSLAVAGGKRFGPYQRLAARAGISDDVRFLGSVRDLVPLYGAADVYVHPSFYDPCSLVVLEALACGLPVITTRFNGASELLTEAVQGYVIDDPRNHKDLADRIGRLFDRRRRRRMSTAARQLALQHSFAQNCLELLAAYQEVPPPSTKRRFPFSPQVETTRDQALQAGAA